MTDNSACTKPKNLFQITSLKPLKPLVVKGFERESLLTEH